MKKQFITGIMLMTASLFTAQNLSTELKNMIKNDDVSSFEKVITKDSLNNCYTLEEASYSLMAIAIKVNKPNIFQKLLEEGADPNHICDDKTPLMYASKYGNVEMAKKLLEYGAKKNLTSQKGYTALDYAKKYDKKEIEEILKQ